MTDQVSFDEEPFNGNSFRTSNKQDGGITGFFIRNHILKNKTRANSFFVIVSIIAIILTILLFQQAKKAYYPHTPPPGLGGNAPRDLINANSSPNTLYEGQ